MVCYLVRDWRSPEAARTAAAAWRALAPGPAALARRALAPGPAAPDSFLHGDHHHRNDLAVAADHVRMRFVGLAACFDRLAASNRADRPVLCRAAPPMAGVTRRMILKRASHDLILVHPVPAGSGLDRYASTEAGRRTELADGYLYHPA